MATDDVDDADARHRTRDEARADTDDRSDDDTGWLFQPQSDEEADLAYLGQAPAAPTAPPPAEPLVVPPVYRPDAVSGQGGAADASGTSPVPSAETPRASGALEEPTAPYTPVWSAATTAEPSADTSTATERYAIEPSADEPTRLASAVPPVGVVPPVGAVPAEAVPPVPPVGTVPPVPPGPATSATPAEPDDPPARGSAVRAIAWGALVGTVVLLLAWYFLLRDPSADATRAVPASSTAATPSATAATPGGPSSGPTSGSPRPASSRTASASPSGRSPSATPTSALNDAGNRFGWTFLIDGLGPVKLGLRATEAVRLGVLQAVPTACDGHSPTDRLGDTRVYSTDGRVSAIDIRSAAFPSGRGLRVGTTLAALRQSYGDSLKQTEMTDGGTTVEQWALTSGGQYIAYLVDGAGVVTRIAIGYRTADGSITLPPPC